MGDMAAAHDDQYNDTTGSCLFHAIALCFTDIEHAYSVEDEVRRAIVNYLEDNQIRDDGSDRAASIDRQRFPRVWEDYLTEMRQSTTWGDEICLQACHERFNVNIVLHVASTQQTRKYPHRQINELPVIHLGIEDSHYYAFFQLPHDPAEREAMSQRLIGKKN